MSLNLCGRSLVHIAIGTQLYGWNLILCGVKYYICVCIVAQAGVFTYAMYSMSTG